MLDAILLLTYAFLALSDAQKPLPSAALETSQVVSSKHAADGALVSKSMSEPIHIISLGAGVQSSTDALMASEGESPPMPDLGCFADTQREPLSVYLWLSKLCGVQVRFRPNGRPYVEPGVYHSGLLKFPVHIVTKGDIGEDALRVRKRKDGNGSWVRSGVPHYSINADGLKGHGPRQCTYDFKIIPLEQEQRRLIGKDKMRVWRKRHRSALKEIAKHEKELSVWKRAKKAGLPHSPVAPLRPEVAWAECQADPLVVVRIGISTDEAGRAKPSRIPWAVHRWPHLERGTNRDGCVEWLAARNLKAPKSACEFCPYHDDDEWIRLRDVEPESFARAVQFDYAYRAAKIKTVSQKGFKPYLHNSRVPLDKVKFQKLQGKQLTMFNNECQGMCGV